MKVAIVTDGSSCLRDAAGLTVVPLPVSIDGVEHAGGVPAAQVLEAMRHGRSVSTSRPAPGGLAAQYRVLLDAGASAVVSVHLSARLSGTVEAARRAAGDFGGAVRVLDSGSVAYGLGFAALEALAAARDGAEVDAVISAARGTSEAWFSVENARALRSGGRFGGSGVRSGVFTARPLLHLDGGTIVPIGKTRTLHQSVRRLTSLTLTGVTDATRVAVCHAGAPSAAEKLRHEIKALAPEVEITLTEVDAVLAAHVGPGMVGAVRYEPVSFPQQAFSSTL